MLCGFTYSEVGRQDVVGGDHHVLRRQELLVPVAIGSVVQVDVELHVRVNVLFKLVLRAGSKEYNRNENLQAAFTNSLSFLMNCFVMYQPVAEHRKRTDDESGSCRRVVRV